MFENIVTIIGKLIHGWTVMFATLLEFASYFSRRIKSGGGKNQIITSYNDINLFEENKNISPCTIHKTSEHSPYKLHSCSDLSSEIV